MLTYFIKRLILVIPTFFISTFIIFLIIHLSPGSIVYSELYKLLSSGTLESDNSIESIQLLKNYYAYDQPIIERYFIWLGIGEREINIIYIKDNKEKKYKSGSIELLFKGKKILIKEFSKIVDTCSYRAETKQNKKFFEGRKWSGEITYEEAEKYTIRNIRLFEKARMGILNGYFGTSYVYSIPVIQLIEQRLPISLSFGIIGLFFSYFLGIVFGIIKSFHNKSLIDKLSNFTLIFLYSIPGWILGSLLLISFGTELGIKVFPLGGLHPQAEVFNNYNYFEQLISRIHHFILPGISYSAVAFSTLALLTYNSINDNIKKDYVLTALSKGLSLKEVIIKHILRNSLIPIFSRIGHVIGFFLAGSYFIEYLFNLDGIGKLVYDSIISRDYPVLFAFMVFTVSLTIIGNILSDFAVSMINPKIRFTIKN